MFNMERNKITLKYVKNFSDILSLKCGHKEKQHIIYVYMFFRSGGCFASL